MLDPKITQLVTLSNQKATTTSILIAEAFGKHHKNILQSIDRLECSAEFTELNFQPSSYQDTSGRMLPCFEITRDGFTFLAMGFTGKKAAEFKEAFIAQFNKMEKLLLDGAADVKRYEFNHHRSTSAPGGLDVKFTLGMTDALKDLPPVARLIALQELTGRDLSKAIEAMKTPAISNRDTELAAMSRCLDLLLDDDGECYDGFRFGFDGQDRGFVEGTPYEINGALEEIAQANGMSAVLDNRSRFFDRLRDKHLLKQIGWMREHSGSGQWQQVRYIKLAGGAA